MVRYIVLLFYFLTFCNCSPLKKEQDKNTLKELSWLLGRWSNISNQSRFYEIWESVNDSVFMGTSFLIIDTDTVFSEDITLKSDSSGIFYIPKVKGQNDEAAISFQLISSKGEWVFENKEHDFPSKIIYSNSAKDSLYARIEGRENGKYRKEEFVFKRE